MSRRTWLIAGGALLVVAGGVAAVAQVGGREGRWGRGGHDMMGRMGGDDLGFGPGMGGGRGMRGMQGDQDRRGFWGRGPRSLTQDQFDTRTRERFAAIDKNGDGIADATEIEAAFPGQGGMRGQMGETMPTRFLARYDGDRDGKVTRAEFLERVKKDFGRLDLDGNGRITDEDLPPMMRGRDVLKGGAGIGRGGRMGGGMMLGRVTEADANRDGIITLEEVQAHAGRRFDSLDKSKDGAVDKADFEAMRKEMADYRVKRFVHANGGKDGRVTRDQFYAARKERFSELDANRDGRLDREDFAPGMGRGGGMGPGGPGMGPGGPGGRGPGFGPGQGPGPGGPGMQDRQPPR